MTKHIDCDVRSIPRGPSHSKRWGGVAERSRVACNEMLHASSKLFIDTFTGERGGHGWFAAADLYARTVCMSLSVDLLGTRVPRHRVLKFGTAKPLWSCQIIGAKLGSCLVARVSTRPGAVVRGSEDEGAGKRYLMPIVALYPWRCVLPLHHHLIPLSLILSSLFPPASPLSVLLDNDASTTPRSLQFLSAFDTQS